MFAPTDEQLAAIPRDGAISTSCRSASPFEPVIETPHGPTQAEIRMMYVWTDRLRAVLPLVRMGRGKMMGVDHNKGLRWVGGISRTGRFPVESPPTARRCRSPTRSLRLPRRCKITPLGPSGTA